MAVSTLTLVQYFGGVPSQPGAGYAFTTPILFSFYYAVVDGKLAERVPQWGWVPEGPSDNTVFYAPADGTYHVEFTMVANGLRTPGSMMSAEIDHVTGVASPPFTTQFSPVDNETFWHGDFLPTELGAVENGLIQVFKFKGGDTPFIKKGTPMLLTAGSYVPITSGPFRDYGGGVSGGFFNGMGNSTITTLTISYVGPEDKGVTPGVYLAGYAE